MTEINVIVTGLEEAAYDDEARLSRAHELIRRAAPCGAVGGSRLRAW
jgi:hypothetical protein